MAIAKQVTSMSTGTIKLNTLMSAQIVYTPLTQAVGKEEVTGKRPTKRTRKPYMRFKKKVTIILFVALSSLL